MSKGNAKCCQGWRKSMQIEDTGWERANLRVRVPDTWVPVVKCLIWWRCQMHLWFESGVFRRINFFVVFEGFWRICIFFFIVFLFFTFLNNWGEKNSKNIFLLLFEWKHIFIYYTVFYFYFILYIVCMMMRFS